MRKYGALGRVTRTTDGEGHAVEVAYAANGTDQVESLTDAKGNTTRWTYDEWERKTRKTYADNSAETYAYDAVGRMTNKLDTAGVASAFAYDANGNLTGLQRGNECAFAFGYDALDRRTNVLDAVGTTAWTYDALGRVTGETGPFGTGEVQVAYDANGRMTNVTWGTYSARYAYDELGRITNITAPEGEYAFTYHANGIRRAGVTYPNGVAETRTHDELARVTGLAFATGTNEWLSVAYAYDAGDRRTNEVWSTGREMAYGYDDAHQLTEVEASRPSDEARYCYDPAGNPMMRAEMGFETTNEFNNLNQILSASWTGSTITAVGMVNYPAGTVAVSGTEGTIYPDKTFDAASVPVHLGANCLTNVFTDIFGRSVTNTTSLTITNRAYAHDANGNLTNDGVFQYQYDAANQLTNVIRKADNTTVLSCRYDALGRRVEAIRADGTVDRYVYFPGSFLVLAVLDGTNAVKEIYTRGPDLSGTLDSAGGIGGILACTYASGATYYSHADIMGNVIALTDASGSVVSTFRYTPFGQLSARTGTLLPRYLFSSKEFDRTASLYYYGYRYYSPRLARWMTRDPLEEEGGLNLYVIAGNDTCGRFDRVGLLSERPPEVKILPGLIYAALKGWKDVKLSGVALEAIKKGVRGEIEKQKMPDKCKLGESDYSEFVFNGNMQDWNDAERTRLGADSAIKTLLDLFLHPMTATSWTFGRGQITCKGSIFYETDKTWSCCCRVKAKFSNVSCTLSDEWDFYYDPHRGKLYQLASKWVEDIWHKKLGAVKLNVTADWEDSWDKNRCDDVKFIPFM